MCFGRRLFSRLPKHSNIEELFEVIFFIAVESPGEREEGWKNRQKEKENLAFGLDNVDELFLLVHFFSGVLLLPCSSLGRMGHLAQRVYLSLPFGGWRKGKHMERPFGVRLWAGLPDFFFKFCFLVFRAFRIPIPSFYS